MNPRAYGWGGGGGVTGKKSPKHANCLKCMGKGEGGRRSEEKEDGGRAAVEGLARDQCTQQAAPVASKIVYTLFFFSSSISHNHSNSPEELQD